MPSDDLDDAGIYGFLNKLVKDHLTRNGNYSIIDLKYFAKYNKRAGFKLSIDGFHNLRKNGKFITLYCLNPNAVLYKSIDAILHKEDLNEGEEWEVSILKLVYIWLTLFVGLDEFFFRLGQSYQVSSLCGRICALQRARG